MIPPDLREYAETPDRYSVMASELVTRYADDRVCIIQGPTFAAVSGVRTDDVEELLREVRERMPAEKEPAWWIGPSAEPADLYERLQGLGLREPRDRAMLLHALVATEPPAEASRDVEVHEIRAFEDFAAAAEVRWEAFETPPHRVEANRGRLQADYEDAMRVGIPRRLRRDPRRATRGDGDVDPVAEGRLPDRRRDRTVGPRPRALPGARPGSVGRRVAPRDTRTRDAR